MTDLSLEEKYALLSYLMNVESDPDKNRLLHTYLSLRVTSKEEVFDAEALELQIPEASISKISIRMFLNALTDDQEAARWLLNESQRDHPIAHYVSELTTNVIFEYLRAKQKPGSCFDLCASQPEFQSFCFDQAQKALRVTHAGEITNLMLRLCGHLRRLAYKLLVQEVICNDRTKGSHLV